MFSKMSASSTRAKPRSFKVACARRSSHNVIGGRHKLAKRIGRQASSGPRKYTFERSRGS